MTTHNQTAQHAAPKHRWAWRLGAAVGVRRWPKRLAVGVAAWIVLGVTTAWLDPWAAGLVSLLGGVGAWLSAGVGLMITTLVTHGSYRRHGVLAALAAAAAALAVTGAAAVWVDWSAVIEIISLAVIGIAALCVFVFLDIQPRMQPNHSGIYDDDGYRDGVDGQGHYLHGIKIGD